MSYSILRILLFSVAIFILKGNTTIATTESEKQEKQKSIEITDIIDTSSHLIVQVYWYAADKYINIRSFNKIDFAAVYDDDGARICEKKIQNNRISLDGIEQGQYYLSLISNNEFAIKSIIIE